MNITSLSLLSGFIARNEAAWAVFEKLAGELVVASFEYSQQQGSWLLTDSDGGLHFFRQYRSQTVAIISKCGNAMITDGEWIALASL